MFYFLCYVVTADKYYLLYPICEFHTKTYTKSKLRFSKDCVYHPLPIIDAKKGFNCSKQFILQGKHII